MLIHSEIDVDMCVCVCVCVCACRVLSSGVKRNPKYMSASVQVCKVKLTPSVLCQTLTRQPSDPGNSLGWCICVCVYAGPTCQVTTHELVQRVELLTVLESRGLRDSPITCTHLWRVAGQ